MRPISTSSALFVLVGLGCSPAAGSGTYRFDAGDLGSEPDTGVVRPPGGDVPIVRDAIPIRDNGSSVIQPDAACSTTTADARRLPLNLLILLDRSGSMGQGTARPTKWESAVAGISRLLMRLDDTARVGLTFFPTRSGTSTTAAAYSSPAVRIDPLSTTRRALLDALMSASPMGETPMACAAQGTNQYFGMGFPHDGSRNVILITDGAPTEECSGVMCGLFDVSCLLNASRQAADAVRVAVAMGQRQTPPVRFFVAGTPDASNQFLSDLAVIGGTRRSADCTTRMDCHYSLGTSTFDADLNAALDDIRGRALTCEFTIETDPTRVDPTRVNVNVSIGAGAPTLIPRDVSHRDGWDYGEGMRTVVLHGPTCDRVRSDGAARVQILLGCPTATPG